MRRAYHLKPPSHQRKYVVPIVEEVVEEDVDNDSPLADSGKRKETEASQGDNNPPSDVSLPPLLRRRGPPVRNQGAGLLLAAMTNDSPQRYEYFPFLHLGCFFASCIFDS